MRREQELSYLVAPPGHPNFSDEPVASAWLHELARRRLRARVVLDYPLPRGLPAGVDAAVSGGNAWLYAADTVVRHG